MGLIEKLFRRIRHWQQENTWIKLDKKAIPYWVSNHVFKYPGNKILRGNTFIYKVIDQPGETQGSHIITVYRRLKRD